MLVLGLLRIKKNELLSKGILNSNYNYLDHGYQQKKHVAYEEGHIERGREEKEER